MTNNTKPNAMATATHSGTATPKVDTSGLSQNLVASTSPTTTHSAADAARAMDSCSSWQPRLDRRQSWDSQEYKHIQQRAVTTDKAAEKPQSGFTERR
ncbi:hypothetical protein B0T16DRAFT_188959 [Cercophora newfieldiana]|uniref:Uncharacterized protein n=1 Tax=Cercophora newfieldiana TaxID=92897 RepID=A0AA39Y3E6_9PEZI|nr:hypothetical protein B0T16DRAFT_188959 [Cercophora newfieldiana]